VRWTHDPDDPVPSRVEDAWATLADPPDEEMNAARPDVLTFTGEPLAAPLDLTGPQAVDLLLRSSGPSTHAIAHLVDVPPEGPSRRFAEGAAFVRDAREEQVVTVDLGHCAYRLAPGHRLRLQVMSSCYPRYLLHPGTAEDPWTATTVERTDQELRPAGSVLRLTVRR
jgi:putative CocE/NonD family hydrolase